MNNITLNIVYFLSNFDMWRGLQMVSFFHRISSVMVFKLSLFEVKLMQEKSLVFEANWLI
jgi:hypothetical protein